MTAGGTEVWTDDVESGAGDWTTSLGTFAGTTGAGWLITNGVFEFLQYYLAEWRNFDGFDKGLKYTYDSDYLRFDNSEWSVQRVAYNAPGMLVWYRDTQYGNQNWVTVNEFAGPSAGSKGGLLLVDSHFDPLRRKGAAADADPSTLNNIQSRPQASNVAFTKHATYRFTECLEMPVDSYTLYCTQFGPQDGKKRFTDRRGWYPGFENRVEGLFRRDIDASVVVPSRGNQWYSTRIVDSAGDLISDLFGFDLFGDGTIVLGTGRPRDGLFPGDDSVAMGVAFEIKSIGNKNRWATIWVDPGN